jgi:HD-like signal output (HDOD) protein
MPGMDGIQLLSEVMTQFPQVVRIILSGHSDHELILKSTRPAHQYLSKPCDTETLKTTVKRAFALRDLLSNDSLKSLISRIESLPVLPSVYVRVREELQSQDASIDTIGNIISKDVAMTAKILQLVNSAFFGLPRHVSSPAQACALLGLDIVKGLVLSLGLFSQFDVDKCKGFSLETLWKHCMVTGAAAKALAKEENQERVLIDEAFLAGVLHDIGKLILAASFDKSYTGAVMGAQEKQVTLWEAETEVFGTTHSAVGAYLIGLWGLPDSIVEALAFHHNPGDFPGDRFSPLLAVHSANALIGDAQADNCKWAPSPVDADYLAEIGLADRLPVWKTVCDQVIQGEDVNG